jgi:SAM-dependent methyltransferase
VDQPFSDVEEYNAFEIPSTTGRDCDFVDNLLGRGSESIELLDLACGTGRHALELASKGYLVTGVDLSSERIAYAVEEAEKRSLRNCTFLVEDLLKLDLGRQFDCITCFFNTVSLFASNKDIIQLFKNVHNHLADDGRFIFHLYNMWPSIAEGTFDGGGYESTVEHRGITRHVSGSHIISTTNNTYLHTQRIRYSEEGADFPEQNESVLQRVYSANEIDLLGRMTGLSIRSIYAGMDVNQEIVDIDHPPDIFAGELAFCCVKTTGSRG